MGVASGCGEQEVGVASGSGWNLWVWLLGVVVRRYISVADPGFLKGGAREARRKIWPRPHFIY